MADFSGRKVAHGIAKETTTGTAVNPAYWLYLEDFDFSDTATTTLNQSALYVLDKYNNAVITEAWSTGKLGGKVTDQSFGLLLWSTLGTHSVATHSGESAVYDHTFSESQLNNPQSLTVTRIDPNVQNQYASAIMDSLEIDIKTGDYVRQTSNFMAMPTSNTTGLTAAFLPENEFTASNVVVKMANTVSGLTGATAIPATSVTLTIDKSATNYWILGQNAPGNIFATETEIKGEIVLRYSTQAYYNLRFQNTQQAVSITCQNTGVTIGTGSHPTLTFTMPQCFLNDWKISEGLSDMVEQTIDFEATYSLGSAYALQTVLTNTVATY